MKEGELKMFNNSAEVYDALYSYKDYKQESLMIRDYIFSRNPNANSVLDVACGTGKHTEYLSSDFTIDGIDINESFVQIAKNRNPRSNFWNKDMTSFHLNKHYDIVMCLFSSIAYVKTLDYVKQTVEQFKNHLTDQGLIIIEPWFQPNQWNKGYVSTLNGETDDFKVSRMSHADREGNISILNFEYLLGTSDGIQHYTEKHELGLFTHEELLDVFTRTGLNVEYDKTGISGRGTYVLSRFKEEGNSV
jgi:trans-aconitate methyltransferase